MTIRKAYLIKGKPVAVGVRVSPCPPSVPPCPAPPCPAPPCPAPPYPAFVTRGCFQCNSIISTSYTLHTTGTWFTGEVVPKAGRTGI